MHKRTIALFLVMMLSLSGLTLKLVSINSKGYKQSAAQGNTRSITVSNARGTFYDCNMKPIVNSQDRYLLAIKPTPLALSELKGVISDKELEDLAKDLSDGLPAIVSIPYEMRTGKDMELLTVKNRYSPNQAAAHLIGYIDSAGDGVTGLERSYNEYLSKDMGRLMAAFSVDAFGRFLAGAQVELRNENYNVKQGVMLTLDLNIQKIVEQAMDNHKMTKGSAVVVEVGTGEIKAMASRPKYDPNNVGASLKSKDSPLINRSLTAYSVGSTFKAIVASAAIESGNFTKDFKHECTGSTVRNNTTFSCNNKEVHGTINMEEALAVSCNTYFIELANRINIKNLLNIADKMGFSKSVTLASGVQSEKGSMPKISELNSQAAIANLAFGQGKLLATPLHMASAFACIANGGVYNEPYLIKATIDKNREVVESFSQKGGRRAMSRSTAEKVGQMLKFVINQKEKARPDNVSACGKTATAQSGWFKNGVEVYNSWFVGYFPAENPKYAVAVMREQGVSGSYDCAPVFKKIAENITGAK
ncbi:MAG: penicillin-binding protein 2 [Oscillospiraceae bacterium]|jgi:penicillin-binding protein 2|nr:penicillin-binding protein 2 [Oscillospiraceae bacterium]